MEYYAHCDLRSYIREDWEKTDAVWEKQCNYLYEKYETLSKEEARKREESKSAKVAKKLEALKRATPDYSDTVLLKKIKANGKR